MMKNTQLAVRNYLTITWGINFGFSNAERVSLNLAVASAKVKEAAAKNAYSSQIVILTFSTSF